MGKKIPTIDVNLIGDEEKREMVMKVIEQQRLFICEQLPPEVLGKIDYVIQKGTNDD